MSSTVGEKANTVASPANTVARSPHLKARFLSSTSNAYGLRAVALRFDLSSSRLIVHFPTCDALPVYEWRQMYYDVLVRLTRVVGPALSLTGPGPHRPADISAAPMSELQADLTAGRFCYQCDRPVKWLAPDGRCSTCTRCSLSDVFGDEVSHG